MIIIWNTTFFVTISLKDPCEFVSQTYICESKSLWNSISKYIRDGDKSPHGYSYVDKKNFGFFWC